MGPFNPKSFIALLEPDGTRLKWTVVRVPFDIKEAWAERKGRRVKGTVNGFAFRTTLFPDPMGGGLVLLVNKKMQAAAGVRPGDRAAFVLEPDLEARETVVPPELARLMRQAPGLTAWVKKMSGSHQREIGKWVLEAATAAGRQKRAEQIAERLLLAMEGERETPPILRAAFQRQPLAEQGWALLTPTQRRNHLLGIFYYQTVEARERRAAKAIEEALQAASKVAGQVVPLRSVGRAGRTKR